MRQNMCKEILRATIYLTALRCKVFVWKIRAGKAAIMASGASAVPGQVKRELSEYVFP